GERVSVGQLRFPRDKTGNATIDTGPGNFQAGFVEVFSGAKTPADVPRWNVSLGAPTADGYVPATGSAPSYSSAAAGVTNADAAWNPGRRSLDIQVGGEVVQTHPPDRVKIPRPCLGFIGKIVAAVNRIVAEVRRGLIA